MSQIVGVTTELISNRDRATRARLVFHVVKLGRKGLTADLRLR